jgi:hypothetical protein
LEQHDVPGASDPPRLQFARELNDDGQEEMNDAVTAVIYLAGYREAMGR